MVEYRGATRRGRARAEIYRGGGTFLAVINHQDKFVALALSSADALKLGVAYFVPYCVSTISSVGALRGRKKNHSAG